MRTRSTDSTTATRQRIITPSAARVIVVVTLVAAVGVIPRDQPPIVVRFLYTSDATPVVNKIAEFNDLALTQDGHRIVIDDEAMPSGAVLDSLCPTEDSVGCEKPSVWLPAASTWLDLLPKQEWIGDPESLFESPQVLAMWPKVADQLGRSGKPITFEHVLRTPDLVFAHARPDSSTSGFHAALAEFALAEGLPSVTNVNDALEAVKTFERRVGPLCEKSSDLTYKALNALDSDALPSKLFDVAYMQETTFASYNATVESTTAYDSKVKKQSTLVAAYPPDAMFVADYPLTVLAGAPWMQDPSQVEAASTFARWLQGSVTSPTSSDDSSDSDRYFFRGPDGVAGRELSGAGAVATIGRLANAPSREELEATQQLWPSTQRPLDLAVVIDSSTDLAPHVDEAREALASLEQNLDDVDRVLTIQHSDVTKAEEATALHDWRTPLRHLSHSLQATVPEPLLESEIQGGLDWLGSLEHKSRQQILIVLSTGHGSDSLLDVNESTVPVFVLPLGEFAQTDPLSELANRTGGRVLLQDPDKSLASEMANAAEAC